MWAAIGRWLEAYWKWAGSLLLLNLIVWLTFENLHSQEIRIEALWTIRAGLLGALLLFDNLTVLWWYADRTAAQVELAQQVRREANKPIVVTIYRETPGAPGDYHWYVKNIGPGMAASVWWVDLEGALPDRRREIALGALGPGDSRPLGDKLEETLKGKHEIAGHLLAAEGLFTRTAQWTVTTNHRWQDDEREIISALVPLAKPDHVRPIKQLLAEEWEAVLGPALKREIA